jgi:hypothetical protein
MLPHSCESSPSKTLILPTAGLTTTSWTEISCFEIKKALLRAGVRAFLQKKEINSLYQISFHAIQFKFSFLSIQLQEVKVAFESSLVKNRRKKLPSWRFF